MLRTDKPTLLIKQLPGIAQRNVVLGVLRRVALVAALAAVIPQVAHADASDDYVACVIGKAVMNLHKGSRHDDAVGKAWIACEPLNKEISENELESISDFVYLTFEKLAVSPGQ